MMQTEPIRPVIEKIARECGEAGATKWQALKIIKELNADEKAGEQKLKERALELLQSLNPEAAKVLESFAKMHVHNSRQAIEHFDRGNIVKSLVHETRANRAIAEKIGAEVEDKIKDLKISHLTTSLIREMVNAKLLEFGFEDLRNKYARLGMPVADIEREINSGLFENSEILSEYSLNAAIPRELSEHHFRAELHIARLGEFCTKPLGIFLSEKTEAQSPEGFAIELLKQINSKKRFFSMPPTINALNFSLASCCRDASEKKAGKGAAFVLNCIKAAFLPDSRKPCFSLHLFVPDAFEKSPELKQKAVHFANAIIEANQGALPLAVAVGSKFDLKALLQGAFEKELVFLNCSSEALQSLDAQLAFSGSSGLLGAVYLNFEKIASKNAGKESAFEADFFEKLDAAKRLLELKKIELQKRQYLKENGVELEALKPLLGLFNPEGAAMEFLGKNEPDRECAAFAENAVKKAREELGQEWVITDFADSEAKKRFAEANGKEQLGKIRAMQLKGIYRHAAACGRKELEEMIDAGMHLVRFSPQAKIQA